MSCIASAPTWKGCWAPWPPGTWIFSSSVCRCCAQLRWGTATTWRCEAAATWSPDLTSLAGKKQEKKEKGKKKKTKKIKQKKKRGRKRLYQSLIGKTYTFIYLYISAAIQLQTMKIILKLYWKTYIFLDQEYALFFWQLNYLASYVYVYTNI